MPFNLSVDDAVGIVVALIFVVMTCQTLLKVWGPFAYQAEATPVEVRQLAEADALFPIAAFDGVTIRDLLTTKGITPQMAVNSGDDTLLASVLVQAWSNGVSATDPELASVAALLSASARIALVRHQPMQDWLYQVLTASASPAKV